MTTAIAENKPFQERIAEKIREQIGELMTDAEIKMLVDRAMDEAFFKPTEVKDRWGDKVGEGQPAIVKLVGEALTPAVRDAVNAYLAAHKKDVAKAIDDAIAKGFAGLVVQYFNNAISGPLINFAQELRNRGMQI